MVIPAAPEHMEAIAELLAALDRFYGLPSPDPRDVRIGQISQALFTDAPAAYALTAWDGDQLVGIALHSFLWPTTGIAAGWSGPRRGQRAGANVCTPHSARR